VSRPAHDQPFDLRAWTAVSQLDVGVPIVFPVPLWKPHSLFDVVLGQIPELPSPDQPLVGALDDTPCRKTGKRIRAAKMLRHPLPPPFHLNLCHALR
jgi:hypothetical protein